MKMSLFVSLRRVSAARLSRMSTAWHSTIISFLRFKQIKKTNQKTFSLNFQLEMYRVVKLRHRHDRWEIVLKHLSRCKAAGYQNVGLQWFITFILEKLLRGVKGHNQPINPYTPYLAYEEIHDSRERLSLVKWSLNSNNDCSPPRKCNEKSNGKQLITVRSRAVF